MCLCYPVVGSPQVECWNSVGYGSRLQLLFTQLLDHGQNHSLFEGIIVTVANNLAGRTYY